MPFFHRKYYYNMAPPVSEQMLLQGIQIIENHPLYGRLNGEIYMKSRHLSGKGSMAAVDRKGNIYLNCTAKASPEEWAYCIAHCLLHLAFGHFDRSSLPEEGSIHLDVWAKACDIYVACFLSDTDFGEMVVPDPKQNYSFRLTDFPAEAPVLIITDGYIEKHLSIQKEHAFLLPKGNRLPFRPRGKVFYFDLPG